MPFLAPALGALLGGVATTVIGQAVIGVALSVGLGYLSRRLQPKPSSRAQGMSLSLRVESNEYREIAFGRVASAGSLKYHNSYGPNGNDYIQLVYVLADHECDALEKVYVNGKAVTLGSTVSTADVSGQAVTEYPGVMWIEFHSGAWTQAADADLVAKSSGGWTSSFRGRGVCYVRVTLKYDAEKFKTGQPQFLFVFRGAKLYSWRKDSINGGSGSHRWGIPSTYEWSNNPYVTAYNFRRGIFVNGQRLGGMSVPPTSLPVAVWTAAANASDEAVALKAGGTEKRYTMAAIVEVNNDHRDVVREIITSTAGIEVDSGGVLKPYAGVAESPVATIVDDDLLAPAEFVHTPKLSRANLVNAVFGTFQDPLQLYEGVALPPRISPADEAADGGIQLAEHYGLGFVTSGTQGQRICEILRRKGRYQRRVTLRLRSRFCVLEAGDWITWNSERYGFSGVQFEVVQATLDRDLTVALELREIAASIFSWTAGTDELAPDNPKAVSAGGSTFTAVQGVDLDNVTLPGLGTQQRPGLLIAWTPVTDATVISLKLEYRKIGDAVAFERTIQDPGAGTYTWLDGVQGGITYEARLRPVTLPERGTTWSSWVSSATASAAQVVGLAAEALYIDPANIPPAELDAQSRFELALVTGLATIQGSVADRLQAVYDEIQATNYASLEHRRVTGETRSRVLIAERTTQTLNDSFASYTVQTDAILNHPVTGLPATATAISGLSSRVTVTETGVDAAEARAFLQINVSGPNGTVTGGIDLYGNSLFSILTLLADKLVIARPDGTGAKQIFTTGLVNGVSEVGISGNVFIDGSVSAQSLSVGSLSAITANLGNVVTGSLRRADNLVGFDLDQGEIYITSPQPLDFRFAVNSGYALLFFYH